MPWFIGASWIWKAYYKVENLKSAMVNLVLTQIELVNWS